MIKVNKGHVEYEGMYVILMGEIIALLHDMWKDVIVPFNGGEEGAREELERLINIATMTDDELDASQQEIDGKFRDILGDDAADLIDKIAKTLATQGASKDDISELVKELKDSAGIEQDAKLS